MQENRKIEGKMSLQEATIKALYDGLKDDTEVKDVEGLIDDVLVVTDPEITTDEYNEVIERAEEIIEETPEGDIPLDPTYLGEYLQTCPICGASFVEDHILEPGTACPVCYETPEAFVMVGKLQAEEEVAEDNGLVDNETTEPQLDTEKVPLEDLGSEETNIGGEEIEPEETPTEETPTEEPTEPNRPRGARLRRNREVASKEMPAGNKLAESKLQEDEQENNGGKELLLGDDNNDEPKEIEKEFELVEATEDQIRDLESNSAFTWEGMGINDDNLQAIVDDLKENTKIKLPVVFYTWKGKLFNEMYGLTENNAYPEDLNFLSIDLDNWSALGNLPIYKMQVGARWLDDIVDNNKVRQDKIDGVEED